MPRSTYVIMLSMLSATWNLIPTVADEPAKPRVKHMIDTHIHLYDPTRPKGVPWPPKNDPVLYKPHLPAEFNRIARKAGVTGVVIVEASDWIEDNQWVLDLVDKDDFYIGLVGRLDLNDPNFARHLNRLSKDKRLVGIRARAGKPIDFGSKVVLENMQALAKAGLTLDILPHGITVADCTKAAKAVPDLRIVVNHALAYAADGKPVDPKWIKEVQSLAKHSNVWCKISGLYQHSAKQPAPKDIKFYQPLLDELWQAFGAKRLVYGSNWPVTKHSGDYASYVSLVESYFGEKGQEARERYFWRNAAEAYKLKLK